MLMLASVSPIPLNRRMELIDQIINFLSHNKEAIIVGASAVVVIDFAIRALKSGAEITSSVLVFALKVLWAILFKPILLLLLWLLELCTDLVIWIKEKRRIKQVATAESTNKFKE